MKKLFNLILVATIGTTSALGAINTGVFKPIEVYANTNEIKVNVNGKNIAFDEQPILENGSVFVPMRAIFEALGYTVRYDNEMDMVYATLVEENYLVQMILENDTMFISYKEYITDYTDLTLKKLPIWERLDSEMATNFYYETKFSPSLKKINGRILVPVRVISEGTGANVKWDSKTQTVSIDTTNTVITNPKTGISYDTKNAKKRVDEYFSNGGNSITNANNNSNTDVTNISDNVNTDMANQVLKLVNIEREKAGISPLTLSKEVSSVAQIKSDDMVKNDYFSHTSPTYGSPFTMLKEFDVSYWTAGENIAKGQKTAQDVMDAWMNSTGHKENILNPKFEELGVGYSNDNGRPVWVQIFIAN